MLLYNNSRDKFIAYEEIITDKKDDICIIFHHGLMSDMNGAKALSIGKFCKQRGYNFIRFDNFGHGLSSGNFMNENITSWISGLEMIANLAKNKILLIGSSMGAWIAMHLGLIRKNIGGIIAIASAVDFTEELIWNKMNIDQQKELKSNNFLEFGSKDKCKDKYPISLDLIEDGRKYLLLQDSINIKCPVHLIHGMQDIDVPYNISERVANKLLSDNVVLKLIKDGDHRLSREQDIRLICNSIDEIVDT